MAKTYKAEKFIRQAENQGAKVTEHVNHHKTLKGRRSELTLDPHKKVSPGELNLIVQWFKRNGLIIILVFTVLIAAWYLL